CADRLPVLESPDQAPLRVDHDAALRPTRIDSPQHEKGLTNHPGIFGLDPILRPSLTHVVSCLSDLLAATKDAASSLGALRERGTPFRVLGPSLQKGVQVFAIPCLDSSSGILDVFARHTHSPHNFIRRGWPLLRHRLLRQS